MTGLQQFPLSVRQIPGDVVKEGLEVDPDGRVVRPESRPGLGIDLNELKKHPYSDGAVGDW